MPVDTSQEVLSTEGGAACPACLTVVSTAVELADYRLFACPRCRSWSSDALIRGAATSFEPENYFRNASSDRDKWELLWRRLHRAPADLEAVLDVGCGTGAYLGYLHALNPELRLEGIELDPGRADEARATTPSARPIEKLSSFHRAC